MERSRADEAVARVASGITALEGMTGCSSADTALMVARNCFL